MNNKKELSIGVAGARWLGIKCLQYLHKQKDVKITYVCFPQKKDHVWWTDIVDEDEVNKIGLKVTPWKEWNNIKFDLVFSVLHGGIFKKYHLENSKYGIINLHCAPLPQYRGCNGTAHAIMNGDKYFGATLHYVDEKVDTGGIINQIKVKINDLDTGLTLYNKTEKAAFKLFTKTVPEILSFARSGKFYPTDKQDESKANYYFRNSLSNKEINFNWPRKKQFDFIRALDFPPHEPAFMKINNKKVYLTINKK